jgi:zinc protease
MRPALASLVLLLAALVAPAASAQPPPTPRAAEIAYRARVLANGLRVYAVLDRSRPEVSVQVWYDVGSKDDPPGRSGFAHLFEHLMFKGARDMPPEYIDQLTESAGGESNASTTEDYTEYHETAPAWLLQRLLWAEAERMGSLTLDQSGLESERKVVESELKQSLLDDPYSPLFTSEIPAVSFPTHPYGRPTIGKLADLRAATLDEVRAFHALYYRPDNAALVVAGDFDPARLDAWVDRYFGPLPKPAAAPPRIAPAEPRRPGARTVRSYLSDPRDPAVVLTFPGPRAASGDAAALAVLNEVMTLDESSPAYHSLADGGLVSEVFSDAELRQRGGIIYLGGIVGAGRSDAEVDAALRAQVRRLRTRVIPPRQLEAAKRQLLVDAYRNRETISGVAALVGRAAIVEGDAAPVNAEIARLEQVSSADLRRVARRYLQDSDCVSIRYHAVTERPRGAHAAGPAAEGASGTARSAVPVPAARPAPSLPEPPLAARPTQAPALPASVERRLPNGLRVIVTRTGAVPLATAVLAVHGGAATDPAGAPGLAKLAGRLAAFGRATAAEGARDAAYGDLGLSADVEVHDAATTLTLSGLADALPQGLALLAEGVVRPPTLSARDVVDARRAIADDVAEAQGDLDELTDAALEAAVLGRPRSVPAAGLRRSAILGRYAQLFRPDNAVLIVTGDVDPALVLALAAERFGGWRAPPAPRPTAPVAAAAPHGRQVLVDLPGSPLVEVAVGARAAGRRDAARPAAELANSAIGGSYTARLSRKIRVERGLTYDVTSTLSDRGGTGLFSARAETDPRAAPEVAQLMLAEIRALAARGPDAEELAARKALLRGDLAAQTRTADDLADLLARQAMSGASIAGLADYARGVEAVTPEEVRASAARLAAPGALSLVVVGDARRLAELRRRFPGIQVVKPADLGPPADPG